MDSDNSIYRSTVAPLVMKPQVYLVIKINDIVVQHLVGLLLVYKKRSPKPSVHIGDGVLSSANFVGCVPEMFRDLVGEVIERNDSNATSFVCSLCYLF